MKLIKVKGVMFNCAQERVGSKEEIDSQEKFNTDEFYINLDKIVSVREAGSVIKEYAVIGMEDGSTIYMVKDSNREFWKLIESYRLVL